MSQMSDIHAELSDMTTQEMERAYVALKHSPSKSVRDEVMQELMAQELDRRETQEDADDSDLDLETA
jgi:hypothetical protein